MAPLGDFARRFEKLVVDNSPAILTAVGVTGTLSTAYLAVRATFQAGDRIFEEQLERGHEDPLSFKEKFGLVWKLYIPAASTLTMTVAAIISANRIGNRRAAALAVAYSVSEKAFDEYRQKVLNRIGDKKEQAVRDEIAQARVDRNPASGREVIFTGSGSVLCYESFTGRYFLCDMETLRKAQNDVNQQILHESYASLGEFYIRVGLPQTAYSEEVGWNTDNLMELHFSPVMNDTGQPCISIDYAVHPIRKYNRLH